MLGPLKQQLRQSNSSSVTVKLSASALAVPLQCWNGRILWTGEKRRHFCKYQMDTIVSLAKFQRGGGVGWINYFFLGVEASIQKGTQTEVEDSVRLTSSMQLFCKTSRVFNLNRRRFKLVSTRRSSVLIFPLHKSSLHQVLPCSQQDEIANYVLSDLLRSSTTTVRGRWRASPSSWSPVVSTALLSKNPKTRRLTTSCRKGLEFQNFPILTSEVPTTPASTRNANQ